jgi:hypothetical protein
VHLNAILAYIFPEEIMLVFFCAIWFAGVYAGAEGKNERACDRYLTKAVALAVILIKSRGNPKTDENFGRNLTSFIISR